MRLCARVRVCLILSMPVRAPMLGASSSCPGFSAVAPGRAGGASPADGTAG